jgi:hypothetical protein
LDRLNSRKNNSTKFATRISTSQKSTETHTHPRFPRGSFLPIHELRLSCNRTSSVFPPRRRATPPDHHPAARLRTCVLFRPSHSQRPAPTTPTPLGSPLNCSSFRQPDRAESRADGRTIFMPMWLCPRVVQYKRSHHRRSLLFWQCRHLSVSGCI